MILFSAPGPETYLTATAVAELLALSASHSDLKSDQTAITRSPSVSRQSDRFIEVADSNDQEKGRRGRELLMEPGGVNGRRYSYRLLDVVAENSQSRQQGEHNEQHEPSLLTEDNVVKTEDKSEYSSRCGSPNRMTPTMTPTRTAVATTSPEKMLSERIICDNKANHSPSSAIIQSIPNQSSSSINQHYTILLGTESVDNADENTSEEAVFSPSKSEGAGAIWSNLWRS